MPRRLVTIDLSGSVEVLIDTDDVHVEEEALAALWDRSAAEICRMLDARIRAIEPGD